MGGKSLKNENIAHVLGMYMSLALLPSENVKSGLKAVRSVIEDLDLRKSFEVFDEYFENYWIKIVNLKLETNSNSNLKISYFVFKVTAERFSVANQKIRTNNCLESENSRLKKIIGTKQNIWVFLSNMIFNDNFHIIFYTKFIFLAKMREYTISRNTRLTYTVQNGVNKKLNEKDHFLSCLMEKLDKKQLTIENFLKLAVSRNKKQLVENIYVE